MFRVSGWILLILLFQLDLLDITETERAAGRNGLDSAIIHMFQEWTILRIGIIKYHQISKKGRNRCHGFGEFILNGSSAVMRYVACLALKAELSNVMCDGPLPRVLSVALVPSQEWNQQ